MSKHQNITEDQLDLMHIIECDSNASQRQIAQKTGLSIGKVNYCLKALIDIGFIKANNITNSTQKINYAYILTCLLYTSPSPRDAHESRMPSSA